MRKIACLPDDDRRELFRNTADKMGLNDAIVEKDFWVCFTLDYLFHRCPWKDSITFKGGTSLSKAFNLISRFSEDLFEKKQHLLLGSEPFYRDHSNVWNIVVAYPDAPVCWLRDEELLPFPKRYVLVKQ